MADNSTPPGWYQAGLDHVWLPYTQMKTARPPLPVVRTEGCRIVLADGRELIDGIASWWTACHGYNHPHIRAAVERQLAAMPHVMFGGLVHEQALTLARRLAALLPGDLDRVFFSDSGSVAVEVAMKMAVQYWLNQGVRGRTKFVAFKGGYHGDTTGAMAVSDRRRHARDVSRTAARAARGRPADGRCARRGFVPAAGEACRRDRRHHRRAAGAGRGRHAVPRCGGAATVAQARRPLRSAADLRRDLHRLRPHRDDVRVRAGWRRSRHHHCRQGAHRRHAAAGRDHRAAQGVRRVLVGRSQARADARADLHGQCARLRRRQCLARPVRARAAARSGASRFLQRLAKGLAPCREMPRRQGRARQRRDRRGRDGADRRSRRAAGAFRGGGRVHPAVRQCRLSDAELHDRTTKTWRRSRMRS